MSHTVADQTSTILVSRGPDTTSMCGHSENQPRNLDQSHVHEQTIFFMASDVQLLQSRHHGTEIRPQVFRKVIVPRGLNSAGFHGFQSIQTVTLGRRHKLRLFLVLEFVLPIRTFLMTIASHERIKLELSAQAVWQFPSFSRKVQLNVHVSRSLSDQFFCVGRFAWSSSISNTSPLSFMRMFAPSWRIIVIGFSGGMNCCLPSADMGSSSTKNRITPFTHHDSSKEIQNLHNLGRAISTTGRNHVRRCHVHGHQTVPLEKSIAPSQRS